MSEPMIQIKKINKNYYMGNEPLHVLKDVTLTVNSGDFIAILGPSGSGKSTLMNIIGCMDLADSGTYVLDGIPVHETKEKKLVNVRNEKIGFIFQNYHLIYTYTVLQNIIMPLLAQGLTSSQAKDVCMPIIEMLGLTDRLQHKPSELSGGQQQRVAIARAMACNPALLLADEPTGALDRSTGQEVLDLFSRLNELGNTIIMITHDLNVAKQAKRIVSIVDGELSEGIESWLSIE